MSLTPETIAHVKQWEGFRAKAYRDPGSKNGEPWTIGYGHTSDSYLQVTPGMRITKAKAEDMLRHDLNEAAVSVDRLVKVQLSPNQRGALISFVFNLGETEFRNSTLLKKLNKGGYDAVPTELARWVYNDGHKMNGLINRRAAEIGLWAKGAHVTSRQVTASPPPLSEKITTPEGIVAAAGSLSGLAGLLSGTGPVQYALAGLLAVGAVWILREKILTRNAA